MKILPLAVAVAMAASAVTASAPLRYNTFVPIGGGNGVNDDVDGVAMIRQNPNGESRVQLVVNGLKPSETYSVMVGETHVGLYGIQTRPSGTGQYTGVWVGDVFPDLPAILIFIHDGGDPPGMPDDVPLENQRAIALPM